MNLMLFYSHSLLASLAAGQTVVIDTRFGMDRGCMECLHFFFKNCMHFYKKLCSITNSSGPLNVL